MVAAEAVPPRRIEDGGFSSLVKLSGPRPSFPLLNAVHTVLEHTPVLRFSAAAAARPLPVQQGSKRGDHPPNASRSGKSCPLGKC